MKTVFADTCYWIAVLYPKDELSNKARETSKSLGDVRIITSEMVLTELLNQFSKYGKHLREGAIKLIKQIQSNPNVKIIAQTSILFNEALSLYEKYDDKNCSLTDCSSFQIMKDQDIPEALTNDKDFEQAGFIALLRK